MPLLSRSAPPFAEPTAVLVRTPNWLGDLMMSTAFLAALVERFPAVPVDLVVRAGFADLPLPHRGRVHAFDRRTTSAGAFGRALRGRGYSHCFVLPPSFSSAWMAWRSGIPHRIGYAGQGRSWLLRPAMGHRRPARSEHLVREYLRLLEPWAPDAVERHRPTLPVDAAWADAHRPPALADVPPGYVVLAPGAEYGPAKQWPVEHYAAAAAALEADGRRIVVAGLPADRPLGERIARAAPGTLNLCGETALPGLVALLARAALLVSNDSGAMHIAAALGLPQVALFGSTNPVWTGPANPAARVLTRNLPCAPCYARRCPLGHTACLTGLAPEQVVAAAEALLTPAA